MKKILKNGGKIVLIKVAKVVGKEITPNIIEFGAKIGNNFIEKQNNLVKIPNLKDVHIDEALRILKEDLNLISTKAIADPNLAYANESDNEVMYSEPKFGSRVAPKTIVKVYYFTQEVIAKSKELLASQVHEFKIPNVIGLKTYEAREDLECLGLNVTEKLEKPGLRFTDKEEGQVTRVTYPNNQKRGAKVKTGDRIWFYYVSEEVIIESKAMKDKKVKEEQERNDKIKKAAKDIANDIYSGAVDSAEKVAKKIRKPHAKKKASPGMNEE